MAKKIILLWSCNLDTTLAIHWFRYQKNYKVITYTANLGQGEYLEPMGELAIEMGAESAHIGDLRKSLIVDFAWKAMIANAAYEGGYLLSSAISRALIMREVSKIAREENCELLLHGAPADTNDKVRFEKAARSLLPDIKVLPLHSLWPFKTREEKMNYATTRGLRLQRVQEHPYSIDRNLWGYGARFGELDDPWVEPPEDVYALTVAPSAAPDEPRYLDLEFSRGLPVALDGENLEPVPLVEKLNKIGGDNGVGRCDVVENRLHGIKSREVYEAPAATILFRAHKALEEITLAKELLHYKAEVGRKYSQLIYDGEWFSSLRIALDVFFTETQWPVSGMVRVKLYKGGCQVVGRKSRHSLYVPVPAPRSAEKIEPGQQVS